jgi:uncharacterized membrane protein YvlD (DUF360 family)
MLMVGRLIDGLIIDDFSTALFASILYSLISWAGATVFLPAFQSKDD